MSESPLAYTYYVNYYYIIHKQSFIWLFSCSQKMVCGLVASIGIMVVEMTLFILRAVRMENAFENKKKT